MLRLDTTTRKIQALLGGAITTNQLPVTVCYSDKTATAYTGGTTVINTNNTTAVDICAAPAASTVRDIDTINVNNADTVSATVTIRYNDNGTTYTLFKATLATGDQLTYVHGVGWTVLDGTGKTKVGSGVNGPSSSTDNALVRWDGTGGTAIQNSGWTLSDTDALNGVSGSVGAPSLTLNGETTSGLYRIGSNNHGYAISGAKVLDISSAGLGVTGTLIATGRVTSEEYLSVSKSTGANEVILGTNSGSSYSRIFMRGNGAQINWEIGANDHVGSALEFTPSTAAGGSTYTTPVVTVFTTGLSVTGTLSATSTFNADGGAWFGTAALATGATTGHLYIPTSAGAPTGVPASKTGQVALQFDTTNNKLYVYDGGWLSTAALT